MKYIFLCFCVLVSIIACSPTPPLERIAHLEQEMRDNSANLDSAGLKSKATTLAEAYIDYAQKNPQSPFAPDYMFRAAGLKERQLNDKHGAMKLWDELQKKFPESELAAQALFRLGYVSNNEFNDTVSARKYYTGFLSRFPIHPLAPSAQSELQFLGKTPAEILKKQATKE